MPWDGSTRRQRLPDDWPRIRTRILARDGRLCTWTDHGQRCTAQATEVDHIDRHGPDEDWNLRSLCPPHHAAKSSAEGHAARYRNPRRRPAEAHPGVRKGGG